MWLQPHIHSPWRRRFAGIWPWVFVIGVAVGTVLPLRHFAHGPGRYGFDLQARGWPDPAQDILWRRGADPAQRLPVEALRTIDGDTFVARVPWDDRSVVTRVRLRGIDAPELKAGCAREYRMAVAATSALRTLLSEGGVVIFNIGPDKYAGRVVADVATARTVNVSAALLAAGHARRYDGGHRDGWCGGGWWSRY
jgi:endonuclease YncB( thermonuclease family)